MRPVPALLASLALLPLLGCPEGTGAFAPGGGAAKLLSPSDAAAGGGAPPSGSYGFEPDPDEELSASLPPGHPQITGRETSKELLEKVEAMKAQLARREKPLEVLVALGSLYYENGRYLDAIDYYRQALELAAPGWKAYLALPASARAGAPARPVPPECARGERKSYAEISTAADALARRGEGARAAACWRTALAPAVEAQVRRGNAWFLAGNPDLGVADHEALLAREPGNPDALFYLGAILHDSAGEDLEKLRRARDAWLELRRRHPRDPRQNVVAENLPALEELIRSGGRRPAAAQAPRPGELSQGVAESLESVDVSDPSFWKAADEQLAEAEALLARGRHEEAKDMAKGLLPVVMMKAQDSPFYARVLTDVGYAYIQLGNGEMGSQLLSLALRREPGNAMAREALAAFQAGRPLPPFRPPPRARAAAEPERPLPPVPATNVPAVPKAAEARSLRALAARGEADFKRGEYQAAATAWKQVLEADPYLAGELQLRTRIAEAEKLAGASVAR